MLEKMQSSTKRTHGSACSLLLLALALSSVATAAALPSLQANVNDTSPYRYGLLPPADADSDEPLLLQLQLHEHEQPVAMNRAPETNRTAITWAHAVNSQRELHQALSSDINMIEADIVLGTLNNTGPNMPVMAHPPNTSSDISLLEFLAQIMAHNEQHADAMKGVKLDFKSIEVFESSLGILDSIVPLISYPLWLNADIISGPVNESKIVAVDPARFFAGCAPYENAVLSIGWTTNWGGNFTEGNYTAAQIEQMLEAIKVNNVTGTGQQITFPVRAGIAANSQQQLHELVRAVNETNESSITVWSSANDFVDVEKLRQLIFSFGFSRVYVDVPQELSDRLDLGRDGSGKAAIQVPSLFSFSLVSACMVLASLWLKRTRL